VGEKLTDGQAYVTLVRLEHQPDASQNGRILIALEENGMKGIPIYESTDEGATWHFAVHAVDTTQQDNSRCNLHWQPHLAEVPRAIGSLSAGQSCKTGRWSVGHSARGSQSDKIRSTIRMREDP
jgi:hypothetical protein